MPWFGKGRNDVPAAWATALEQVLEAVDPTRQVAKFVLTGQHVQALKTVKSGWVQSIGRRNSDAAKKAVATLYAGFGDVDAAVLRRWGRVLDAAWGTHGWGSSLGDVAGCHWPELMLKQAAAGAPSAPLPFTFADLERIAAEDGTPSADLVRMECHPCPIPSVSRANRPQVPVVSPGVPRCRRGPSRRGCVNACVGFRR